MSAVVAYLGGWVGRILRFRGVRVRAQAALLLFIVGVLAFGCGDSSLSPPAGILFNEAPPAGAPGVFESCELVDDSALPSQDLSSPSKTPPVGSMSGAFSVSSAGEARYEIPLWMPPGRGSMQPSLSLAYDSGSASDEGVLGAGFQVRGFSSIARCPKTISRHGEIRGVRDDEEDAFCFDGRPMVPVDPASKRPTEFRTVPDSFAKVVADYGNWWGWDPAKGPRSFQVFTKDGLVHEYGLGSGWVFAKNNVVRSWLLTKTTDQSGNWIAYQYINDKDPAEGFTVETAPWRILYTGHAQSAPSRAVQFHYKKRESPATRVLFARGMGLKRSLVLDRIEMQAGWAFDPVREYRFQYTTAPATKRLLLASVEECTPGTVCKPPTLFTWHHGGGPKFVEHPTPLLAPQSKLTTVMPADLNGDGFEDWLLPDANAPAGSELPITYWHVAQNRTTEVTPGFFDAPSLAYEQVHYQAALPFQPDRGTILDFNHDGRMDVFLHDVQGQYPTWRVLITQPDLTFAMHNTGIARPFPTGVPTPLKLAAPDASGHLADLSGDGMQDLLNCMLIGAEHVWRVHLWSPDVEGFEPDGVKIEELSVYPCNAELYPVDIDADGKVDLVVQEATVTGNGAFFGPGYAVLSAEPKAGAWGWSWSKTGIPTISPGGRILFLDINGDALPDAVRMKADEPTFWTHYNTGAGFSGAFKSVLPEPTQAHAHIKLATVIDFNNDSRQDILIPLPQAGNVPKWTVLQATGHIGDGTFAIVDPGLPFDAVLLDEGVTLADPHGPRVTDFNGDGAQDVLLNVGGTYRVFANSLTNEDLLASVSDGLRARDPGEPGFMPNVQIHYDTLVDRAAATAGATAIPPEARTYLPRENAPEEACDYPVRCVVGPRRVVSRYSIYSGGVKAREFDVVYRNGRYHRLGQGFLGFGERIVRDKATGAGTAELFDNATYDADLKVFPFARQIAHEYRWTPALAHEGDAPEVALELRYTHIQRIFTPSPGLQTYFTIPGVQRQRREQSMLCPLDPLLIEELAHSLAGGGAEKLSDVWRITSKHDAFGNITKEITFTEGIDGDLTIEREIENDEATWRIGYLKKQTECSSVGALSQCRIGKREYDDAGRLFSEAIESADGDPETKLIAKLFRDDFGNVTQTSATDGFGQKRVTCSMFDAEGVFPRAHRNAAGHLYLMKYSPRFGVLKALVDPNGLLTRWAHDGFGRATKEERADGTSTTYSRTRSKDGGPDQDEYNIKLRTQTTGIEDDTVQLDPLGRAVRWWTQGVQIGGQKAPRIVQEIAFDALGTNVASRSQPHPDLKLPTPVAHDHYKYDAMGRIVRHTTPWGAVTTYRHLGRRVEITGPDDAVTVIENDPLGRPVSITDPEKGNTLYEYGPFGWLRSVTDPGGAVTTMERDPFGRVREHTDPDRGTTVAHFNGFGEQTAAVDQAKRQFNFAFDPLGRMVSRTDADGTTTWTYDTAPKGIGRLTAVTGPDGNAVTYAFDALGRPKTTTRTVDGEAFTSELGYDPLGRVSTLAYPQGSGVAPFAIKHDYDPYGHLLAVCDAATSAPFWTLLATDGIGRIEAEEFGDAKAKTKRAYDSEKDRVKSILTKAAGSVVQDLSYNYDKRLNLTRRTDHRQGKSEYFEYDRLDRLTKSYFTGFGRPTTYEYEPNGNIKSRLDVGAYEYDPSRPHAVTSAGDAILTYDDVGNLLTRPGLSIDAYTAFDMPKALTVSDKPGPVTLEYDGHQQRIRKTTWDTETVYFGDLYERVIDKQSGTVAHRYYVYGPERLVSTVTRVKGGVDATLFVHVDHLGSIDALTDDASKVVERRSYDAFGARRNPQWGMSPGSFTKATTRGFTGHEGDEELGLVNMKGRLLDPQLGRFITPDPIISKPHFGQSWNPYSLTLNSPLNYVDPSGFQEEEPASRFEDIVSWPSDGSELIVYVRGPPRKNAEPSEAADVGGVVAPMDVGVIGTSTGFTPAAPPTESEGMRGLEIAGEVGLGAAQGYGELAWDATRELLLTWATGGFYQAIQGYHFYSALYAGYDEKGWLGALSVLNPLAGILTPAANATHEAVKGDYRAAGREGIKALVAAVITVVTIAIVPKPPGSKPPAGGGGTGGGPSAGAATGQVSVPRNAHLAGKTHPKTGIPFDKNGHPNFGELVKEDVKIKPTGSRSRDFIAANEAAGLPRTPDGYTWHHHQDYGRMQSGTTRIAGGLMKAPRGGLERMKGATLPARLVKGTEAPRTEAVPAASLPPPARGCRRGSFARPSQRYSRSSLVPKSGSP